MAEAPDERAQRPRLTRERVLRRAVEIADAHGVEALTMRRLGEDLGVEAMSLYHHVQGKDGLLDGAVEIVLDETWRAADATGATTADADTWRAAVRTRALAAREVVLRHPWLPGVLATRSLVTLSAARHLDAVVGLMRAGGLSFDLTHHGLHALGTRLLGFSPEAGEPETDEGAEEDLARMAELVPHLVAMLAEVAHDDATTVGWCDDQAEFEFGLDLVLDGLDRLAQQERARAVGRAV